jgi:pimeloyl-ACP methyl ester carboxylesterase
MKQKLFYLLLLIALTLSTNKLHAQTEIDINANGRNYSQIFDSLSTGLIPSRIPYGTLYDRVYPWSGLSRWVNGDTTTMSHLFQSWYDAEKSVINSLARPNNYAAMRSVVQQQLFAIQLPIVAINYQFGYFDSTCVQDGRVSAINGMLRDNNGASPYLTKQVTIAGIATDSIYAYKNYALQYGSPLLLNNTSTTIQNVVVNNVTAGTQYTLTAGVAQTIQFTQAGNNVLKFTVKLSNGNSYITNQVVKVKNINITGAQTLLSVQTLPSPQTPIGPSCPPTNELLQSDIPFKGYEESQATNSFADYHIYYHTQSPTAADCERVLRKPIIVLDGFDPRDGRSYDVLYNNYLKNKETGTLLGNDLRDKGYDVIILNFPVLGTTIKGATGTPDLTIPTSVKVNGTTQTINVQGRDGGADYIERNAFLLVKLIQQVNATLAANGVTSKIVVVGPSMGGQISRYALAYMEKQQAAGVANMNHNCRLWVSFDSPHDGANIPMSVQETLRFFGTEGEKVEAKDAYESQLRSPAARQLLIEQLEGQNSTASFHSTYYNNLRANGLTGSNGYPVNLRKISLLNGTGNSRQTYGDGAEVLNGEGRKTFLNIKVFELIDNFMPSIGQSKQIVKEKIAIPHFLGVTFITKRYNVSNPNSRGSMDAVQGSTTDAPNAVYKQFSAALTKQKARQTWYTAFPNNCFIPSISALGFKNSNFDWNTRVDNRNLLCNREINFDNYYIPASNQQHVYLNTANVDWLTQEIDKGQPNCPTICTFAITGGADPLCTNMTSTYYLNVAAPSGTTTNWILSSNLQMISSTPNSVTVKAISNNIATISANIINPCGANMLITRQISAGPPTVNISYLQNGTCSSAGYQTWSLNATSPNTITSWQWTVDNPSSGSWYINSPNSPSTMVDVSGGGGISVTATSSCGTTRTGVTIYSNCLRIAAITAFPNPTTDNVTIAVAGLKNIADGKFSNTKKAMMYEIKIIDPLGTIKKLYKYASGTSNTNISLKGFISGIYTVQAFDGTKWSSVKVIKQ